MDSPVLFATLMVVFLGILVAGFITLINICFWVFGETWGPRALAVVCLLGLWGVAYWIAVAVYG